MAPSGCYQLEKSVASINGLKASNEEMSGAFEISSFLHWEVGGAQAVKPGRICNSHISPFHSGGLLGQASL